MPNFARADTTVSYAAPDVIKHQIATDRGHVVLVNFWATWCAPCVAEYPSLVKLDREYHRRGLDVIAVSLDFPEDISGKVTPFIKARGAAFPQYVLKIGDPEVAIDDFDPTWQGDIPRTFVYNRSGKLYKTLAGEQTLSAFNQAVAGAFKSTVD